MRGSEYRGSLLVLAGGAAAVAVAAGLSYAGFAYSRKRRVDRVLKQYSNALRLTTPQLKRIRDDMLNQVCLFAARAKQPCGVIPAPC